MNRKVYVFLVLVLVLISCKNELAISVPESSVSNELILPSTIIEEPSVSFIAEFSGNVQARITFKDSLGERMPNTNRSMLQVDEKTNGSYFKMPKEGKVDVFGLALWIKKSFHKNDITLKKIIIRESDTVIDIYPKDVLNYFELKNIDFEPTTGIMRPIKENQIPQMWLKNGL